MTDKPELRYEYIIYTDHSISAGGRLPDFERGAHACWYYMICAHANLAGVEEGAIYDGELDTGIALHNIARSVCTMYQLEDPGEFLKFMSLVLEECERINKSWDPRTINPWLVEFKDII